MARRYVGDATVYITLSAAGDYRGTIVAGKHRWQFRDLHAPACGHGAGVAYDSPEAYDSMAGSACSFGSYYTSDNRSGADAEGDTEGYPDAETADAISDAVNCVLGDDGEYEVRRRK